MTWVKDRKMRYNEEYATSHGLMYHGSMLVTVKDSGVGMSEENLKELFQEGKSCDYYEENDGRLYL